VAADPDSQQKCATQGTMPQKTEAGYIKISPNTPFTLLKFSAHLQKNTAPRKRFLKFGL
jgi:hypothetical protein